MSNNPAEKKPVTNFSNAEKKHPATDESALTASTPAGYFKLALYHQGVQMGWLGQDSSEWAILVASDGQALTLENYPYNNITYYRIKGSSRYMSVSNNAYIGFYNWGGATGFTLSGDHLVSDFNGQKLSLYSKDNGYLFAFDTYTVLEVKLVPA